MKNSILIIIVLLFIPTMLFAYDPLFDCTNPDNPGDVPLIHDGSGIPSTMTRWKSSRIQAIRDGKATHFIMRVGSNNVGSVPVGFAVYQGTPGERDPIGTLLIRGYYPSHDFTNAGYYASPFTSAESIEIVSGDSYHLVYLLTPGDEAAASEWRIDYYYPPPRWFCNCKGNVSNSSESPGTGGEYRNDRYCSSSAG